MDSFLKELVKDCFEIFSNINKGVKLLSVYFSVLIYVCVWLVRIRNCCFVVFDSWV